MSIFAISIGEARYWEKTVYEVQAPRHIGKVFMMVRWWNGFRLSYRIPQEEKRNIPDCFVSLLKFLLEKEN